MDTIFMNSGNTKTSDSHNYSIFGWNKPKE